ncbi:MAG: hypothetical protein R2690_00515 [Acidimicrobiales bacterium]
MRNSQGDDYYGILRNLGDVPGVIVESMYLTNPDEGRALESAEVRQIEAQAITTAIVRHLSTQASGTGFRPEMSFAPAPWRTTCPRPARTRRCCDRRGPVARWTAVGWLAQSVGGVMTTGHGALRTTWSDTEPSTARLRPARCAIP